MKNEESEFEQFEQNVPLADIQRKACCLQKGYNMNLAAHYFTTAFFWCGNAILKVGYDASQL